MEDVDWPPLHSLPLTALSQVVDGDADDDSVEPRRIVSSSLDSDDDRSRFRCLFSSDRDLRRLFSASKQNNLSQTTLFFQLLSFSQLTN